MNSKAYIHCIEDQNFKDTTLRAITRDFKNSMQSYKGVGTHTNYFDYAYSRETCALKFNLVFKKTKSADLKIYLLDGSVKHVPSQQVLKLTAKDVSELMGFEVY